MRLQFDKHRGVRGDIRYAVRLRVAERRPEGPRHRNVASLGSIRADQWHDPRTRQTIRLRARIRLRRKGWTDDAIERVINLFDALLPVSEADQEKLDAEARAIHQEVLALLAPWRVQ